MFVKPTPPITYSQSASTPKTAAPVPLRLTQVRPNTPLIADTRLNASESYRYDETNVLAKQREEKTLQKQLQERLAQQIIFRLAPLTQARIDALREQYQEATGNSVESSEAGTEPAAKTPVPAP
jgi:LPS-assembly lipoprotein